MEIVNCDLYVHFPTIALMTEMCVRSENARNLSFLKLHINERIAKLHFNLFVDCLNRKGALLFGWAVFLFLAYKVSKLDREYQEYNPFEVLNLDPVRLKKINQKQDACCI